MARPERETKTYFTWIPLLIDSIYMSKQEWHITEKERVQPRWKVLGPLSFVFPRLRVTYERIVAGGMPSLEDFQLANWKATYEPSSLQDPRYAAFFASTLGSSVPPDNPTSSVSPPTKIEPSKQEAAPPNPAPPDATISDTQEQADSAPSSPQPTPAPRFPPHYNQKI